MVTQSAPIVSLQAPKDVSISDIETELGKIWQSYGVSSENGMPMASRAATFTLVVYEPEATQQLLAVLGFYKGPVDGISGPRTNAAIAAAQKAYNLPVTGKSSPELVERLRAEYAQKRNGAGNSDDFGGSVPQYDPDAAGAGFADAIATTNPCRIIALCPIVGEDEGVKAQVSAYCPIQKQSRSTLICCEYITLRGTQEALERIAGMIPALTIGELPKFLWWKATPNSENELFKRLSAISSSVIIDSAGFLMPEADLVELYSLTESGMAIADLNWRRLASWQELTAETFDPPERRAHMMEIDRITLDYEKGNSTQALMYLGWIASRLQWRPVGYVYEGGEYDIQRVKLVGADGREIEAELAAIPVADVGEIPGDLINLRLYSTNLEANCCTVLCSETGGCMRMESGGAAQSCETRQVTALFDQKAEFLLSQQLQRMGREVLYEESMAVVSQVLKMANG
jgi:glucose-6-phosphate dehydrogenase assembly protein OpcA